MSNLITINDSNFDATIQANDNKVIVDFSATWCGPCKHMLPILESMATKRQDIKIYKVDVDDSPITAKTYNIKSIPSFLFFESGKLIKTQTGSMSEARLLELVGW